MPCKIPSLIPFLTQSKRVVDVTVLCGGYKIESFRCTLSVNLKGLFCWCDSTVLGTVTKTQTPLNSVNLSCQHFFSRITEKFRKQEAWPYLVSFGYFFIKKRPVHPASASEISRFSANKIHLSSTSFIININNSELPVHSRPRHGVLLLVLQRWPRAAQGLKWLLA